MRVKILLFFDEFTNNSLFSSKNLKNNTFFAELFGDS